MEIQRYFAPKQKSEQKEMNMCASSGIRDATTTTQQRQQQQQHK